MESIPDSSLHSMPSSPKESPIRLIRDKESTPSTSRKAVLQQADALRRTQLQGQFAQRQAKLVKYLQHKQELAKQQAVLRQTKSSQWLQNAQDKIKASCPQLPQTNPNCVSQSKTHLKTLYFTKKEKKSVNRVSGKLRHQKPTTCIDMLPQLVKGSSDGQGKEARLMEMGIFSAQSDMEGFLRKFRGEIERHFPLGVDMANMFDLNRMEYHLLHCINPT